MGVARAAAALFRERDHASACVPLLRQLLADEDLAVRSEARVCFRGTSWLEGEEGAALAHACGYARAGSGNPSALASSLQAYQGSLLRHAELVLDVCDAFCVDLVERSRSIEFAESAGAHWLGPVVLRLYEDASRRGESDIVRRSLDAIDRLLEGRVGIRGDLVALWDA